MTSLLGRLPRIHEQATTHVASNFWTAAPVLRKSFFVGNGQTWNGDAAKGNGVPKSGPNSYHRIWPAIVSNCKICSMELALGPWREQACSDVWRTAHQNGSIECMRWPPGRFRMDSIIGRSWDCIFLYSRVILKSDPINKNKACSPSNCFSSPQAPKGGISPESRPCIWWRIFWAVEVLHKWKEPHFPFLGHDSQVGSPHTHFH